MIRLTRASPARRTSIRTPLISRLSVSAMAARSGSVAPILLPRRDAGPLDHLPGRVQPLYGRVQRLPVRRDLRVDGVDGLAALHVTRLALVRADSLARDAVV